MEKKTFYGRYLMLTVLQYKNLELNRIVNYIECFIHMVSDSNI